MSISRLSIKKATLINDLKKVYEQFIHSLPAMGITEAIAVLNYFLKNPKMLINVERTSPLTLLPTQTGLSQPIYAISNENHEIMLFFETKQEIGKGTSKKVMLGHRIDQGQLQQYAIVSTDPTSQVMIEIELQTRASQNTPLIPTLHCGAIHQTDDKKQITLISEKGICDLHDFINKHLTSAEFKLENLIALTWGIIYGVNHLHSQRIAHNDLRKQNFLIYQLTGLFYPAIIDFGNSNIIVDPMQKERDFIFLQVMLKNLLQNFLTAHKKQLEESGQLFMFNRLYEILNSTNITPDFTMVLLNELNKIFKEFQKQFPKQAETLMRNLKLFLPPYELNTLEKEDKPLLDELSLFRQRKIKAIPTRSTSIGPTRIKSKL